MLTRKGRREKKRKRRRRTEHCLLQQYERCHIQYVSTIRREVCVSTENKHRPSQLNSQSTRLCPPNNLRQHRKRPRTHTQDMLAPYSRDRDMTSPACIAFTHLNLPNGCWSLIGITCPPGPMGIFCTIPKSMTTAASPRPVITMFSGLRSWWHSPCRKQRQASVHKLEEVWRHRSERTDGKKNKRPPSRPPPGKKVQY